MKKNSENSKAQRIVFITVAVLILVAALTVRELIRLRPSYVGQSPAPGMPSEYIVTDKGGTWESPAPATPAVTDAPAAGDDGVLSILLVGNDSQRGLEGAADSLAAASYEKTGGALKLILLTRDLYVQIPGHSWDTLGRAYELGGIELLGETVRQNFGIELDGCMVAQYEGLASVIDALGGIDIDLSSEEAGLIGLEEGPNHLSGEQALEYMAIESADGESGREERQRSVMLRVMSGVGNLNSAGILKLAYAALPYISTDLNRTEIFAYALSIYNGGVKSIEKYSIPVENDYEGEYVDGMSVIRTDMEENRRLISSWLYGG